MVPAKIPRNTSFSRLTRVVIFGTGLSASRMAKLQTEILKRRTLDAKSLNAGREVNDRCTPKIPLNRADDAVDGDHDRSGVHSSATPRSAFCAARLQNRINQVGLDHEAFSFSTV